MRLKPNRGSHLPVLIKIVQMTTGPILELGCGIYSTTFLHWICFPTKRRLVTYENNKNYFDFLKSYEDSSFHEVNTIPVNGWDSIDISEPWSIAFIDHSPDKRRGMEAKRLRHADYVVAHDTNNTHLKKQGYDKALGYFKYKWKFAEVYPNTSLWSNKHDISDFTLRGK
jgi:hypothetical protein